MAHGLNLARRPFIDRRPVNVAGGVLAAGVLILCFLSVRTVVRYLDGSRKTRNAIAVLREEISRLEVARRATEARLSRYDVEEILASADDANQIARRRAFSWTRFLDRLEKTLPADTRIAAISLASAEKGEAVDGGSKNELFQVELTLVSRSPEGLTEAIRSFYGSPWFDHPTPHVEERGDRRSPDGRRIRIGVLYRDVEAES
jgi:Tfp pilus assembly protein PilN